VNFEERVAKPAFRWYSALITSTERITMNHGDTVHLRTNPAEKFTFIGVDPRYPGFSIVTLPNRILSLETSGLALTQKPVAYVGTDCADSGEPFPSAVYNDRIPASARWYWHRFTVVYADGTSRIVSSKDALHDPEFNWVHKL
jgi:hypothetical protein